MIRGIALIALGLLLTSVAVLPAARETAVEPVPVRATSTGSPSPAPVPTDPSVDPTADESVLLSRVANDAVARVDPAVPLPTGVTDEGWHVLLGTTGEVVGTGGRVVTWSLEIEPDLGIDMDEFGPEAIALLEQPQGWTATGEVSLQRVEQGAEIRVVLAQASTVDTYCARAGMRTNGRFSCWVGGFAMLNLDRWTGGASTHTDLAVYRSYLINHEVGHGLGFGHRSCPAAGAPAPVMMQQTKTVGACVPNGLPVP